MVDENRTVASRIDGEIRQAHEEMAALREELADTSRRLEEHLTVNLAGGGGGGAAAKNSNSESSNELSSSTGHTLTSVTSNSSGEQSGNRSSESSSSKNKYDHLDMKHSIGKIEETDFPLTSQNQSNGENTGDNNLVASKKLVGIDLNRCKDILDSSVVVDSLDLADDDGGIINCDNSDRKSDASIGEMKQLIRPPSPIPGPSSKSDFGKYLLVFNSISFAVA